MRLLNLYPTPCKVFRSVIIAAIMMVLPIFAFCQLPYPKWVNQMGGSGDSKPTGMVIDQQNNIYVSGYFSGTVDFDPSAGVKNLTSVGGYDIYVAKYTQAGVLVWAESMGGPNLDQVNYMCVDGSGNITITGQDQSTFDADPGPGVFMLNNQGGDDIFMIHLDTNGAFLWAKLTGGSNTDRGEEVNADNQGNVIQTAIFSSTITLGSNTYNPGGLYNGLVAKYSQTGNLLWSLGLGGSGNNTEVYGNAVDANNDIIVSGVFSGTVNFNPLGTARQLSSTPGLSVPFIAKYSPSGQLVWVNQLSGNLTNNGSFINVDSKNNIYLSGSYGGTLKFNANTSISGNGSSNMFIAKYLPDGTFTWGKTISGSFGAYAFAYQMQTDQDSNIYLTGYFSGTVDFNPDPAVTANLNDSGQRDFFLAKYDGDGNYKWAFNGGSQNCNLTLGIELAINASRDLYVGGSFCSTVDFDPSKCNIVNRTAINQQSDTFIAAYSQYTPTAELSQIIQFNIPGQTSSVIDAAHASITVVMPPGTDVTHLSPVITTDKGGSINPGSGVALNFTNPVNYVVSTSCSSLTYTVTVVSAVATTKLTACGSDASTLTGSTVSPASSAYLWQINQNGSWVAADGNNAVKDYIITANQFQNNSGAAITYSFRRQLTAAGGAINYDSYYDVAISPTTGNNVISSNVTQLCGGQSGPVIFTGNQPVGYTSTVTYTWQSSLDNVTWQNVAGATQQNYQQTGALLQTTYFRRATLLGSCTNYSNTVKIDYLPAATVANAGTAQEFCQQIQATLNANAAAADESGIWTVVSPAGYNPFTVANQNNPQALITNIPADVNVVLKWTITKPACGQSTESTVTLINHSASQINTFSLPQQTGPASINQTNHTIAVTVFYGTDVTALSPAIRVNAGVLSPASGTAQNFTLPVIYLLSSPCGAVNYKATVTVHTKPMQLTICPGTNTTLAGESPAVSVDSFEWQLNNGGSWSTATGSANVAGYQVPALVNTSTDVVTYSYRRKINSGANVFYDSFYDVGVNPSVRNTISADQSTICSASAQTVNLSGNAPTVAINVTYRWERSADATAWVVINGAVGQNYTYTGVFTQSLYFRRVAIAGGCEYVSNNITITYAGVITTANAGNDQAVCNQTAVALNSNVPAINENGSWSVVSPLSYQPFNAANMHTPTALISNLPADIDVQLKWTIEKPACGQTTESIVTLHNYSLPIVDAGADASINVGESVTLKGSVNGNGISYQWWPAQTLSSPNMLNPVATPAVTTTYYLTATSRQGCTTTDSVKIRVNTQIVLPNTFTPNGDGVNDTWNIKHLSDYESAEISIFTRWGQKVFFSKGYPKAWDGTYNGKKLAAGVYYYLIVISEINTRQAGAVTIIH